MPQFEPTLLIIYLAQEDATEVKKLTKSDMVDFYAHFIAPISPARAKLVVHLVAQGTSTKTEEASTTEIVNEIVPTNDTKPFIITEVRDFKARLEASAGARPARELSEFEDSDAKL